MADYSDQESGVFTYRAIPMPPAIKQAISDNIAIEKAYQRGYEAGAWRGLTFGALMLALLWIVAIAAIVKA